jgi:hypothetical protein
MDSLKAACPVNMMIEEATCFRYQTFGMTENHFRLLKIEIIIESG